MDFFRRHQKKVLALVGVALSSYLFIDYVKKKFFEIQGRLSSERTAKQNLRRRFEQNQQDADFTIMALLSSLTTPLMERYPVDQIKAELQSKRRPTDRVLALESSTSSSATAQTVPTMTSGATEEGEKSKTQLWQDLKRTTISRAFSLVYADALLIFFTRLQLNILGRRNYVNSVVALAQQGREGNAEGGVAPSFGDLADMGYFGDLTGSSSFGETIADPDLDEQYLTFSWWLLNEGWVSLSERVEEAVRRVWDPVSPKAELGFDELSELIGRTQMLIDRPLNPSSPLNFLSQLLPPREQEEYVLAQNPSDTAAPVVGPTLRRLLDETADFVESPNAAEVIERLVHSGLSVFMDKLAVTFGATPSDSGSPYAVVLPTAKVKLPSILANMARQAGGMAQGSPGVENEYVDVMNQVQELTSFSAVVYSSFDWAL